MSERVYELESLLTAIQHRFSKKAEYYEKHIEIGDTELDRAKLKGKAEAYRFVSDEIKRELKWYNINV